MNRLSISLLVAALVSLSADNAMAAFTLTATHKDKLVTDSDTGDYSTWGTGSTAISGTLNFSGFDPSVFTSSSDVVILLDNGGYGGIYFNLGDATISGTAAKPVISYTNIVQSLFSIETTKVKLSFTTNTLTASITTDYDAFDIGVTPNGKITQQATLLTFSIGSMTIEPTLYLSGASVTTTKNLGSVFGSFDLTSVNLSGVVDTTPPVVAFLLPANKYKTSNDTPLLVTGSVKDTYSVSQVAFFATNSSRLTGTETFTEAELIRSNAWQASVTLTPGTNYVFVKALDGAGNGSTPVSRMFYYAKMSPLALTIDGSGTVTSVSNGQQLELGRGYTATAKAGPGSIFRGWKDSDGNVLSTNLARTFLMSEGLTLRAAFIPNPYTLAKGTYNGLFYGYDTNGTTLIPTNSGFLTLTLTTNGNYSAKVTMVAGSYSFTGQLGLVGDDTNSAKAAFSIKRAKLPNLEGSLTCDLTGSGKLSGSLWQTITNAATATPNTLTAQYDGLLASTRKPAAATLYNLAITDLADLATGQPRTNMGAGYGSIAIDKNNAAKLTLSLPDTTPAFATTGSLSVSNTIPIFSPMYSKTGLFMGWLSAVTNTESDFETTNTVWIRPASKTPKYYTNGFSLLVTSLADSYVAPKTGTNILGWTNGCFQWGGNLTETGVTNTVSFLKNAFAYPAGNANTIKMTLAPTTGIITGTYGTGKNATSFKAVILPKTRMALGFSTSATQTGWVLLYPLAVE